MERRLVECRAAGSTLEGVAMRYGDTAFVGGRRERFEPGAFAPLPDGLPLTLQHDASIVLAPAVVLDDGPARLEVRAELGPGAADLVRRRALSGLSVEFHSREERDAGGIRVVSRAELVGMSLVDKGAYRGSGVEVRWEPLRLAVPDWIAFS